jgi:ATP-dependent helicase/nuclease subunit B
VFLEPDGPYGDPACAYLADRLFDYAAPPLTEDMGSVELYCMSSRLGECRLAAARILELLREDGSLRFSDFAVAVPSYEAYSAAIDRAFRDYGVPLYSGEKSELAQKSLVAFVLEALETVNGGWQYKKSSAT